MSAQAGGVRDCQDRVRGKGAAALYIRARCFIWACFRRRAEHEIQVWRKGCTMGLLGDMTIMFGKGMNTVDKKTQAIRAQADLARVNQEIESAYTELGHIVLQGEAGNASFVHAYAAPVEKVRGLEEQAATLTQRIAELSVREEAVPVAPVQATPGVAAPPSHPSPWRRALPAGSPCRSPRRSALRAAARWRLYVSAIHSAPRVMSIIRRIPCSAWRAARRWSPSWRPRRHPLPCRHPHPRRQSLPNPFPSSLLRARVRPVWLRRTRLLQRRRLHPLSSRCPSPRRSRAARPE